MNCHYSNQGKFSTLLLSLLELALKFDFSTFEPLGDSRLLNILSTLVSLPLKCCSFSISLLFPSPLPRLLCGIHRARSRGLPLFYPHSVPSSLVAVNTCHRPVTTQLHSQVRLLSHTAASEPTTYLTCSLRCPVYFWNLCANLKS